MFPTHDLAALIAVAESGSIHQAAAVLGRTQPAVTQAIRRLEEAVGFALLDRSGYRAKLTERGETFAKRARATVKQARDLRAFANVLSRGVEARLRISIHGAIPTAYWMPLIAAIPERFPETVVELQVGEGDAPIRQLQSDAADLAIVLSPTAAHHAAGIEQRYIGDVEFVNVVQAARLVSNEGDDLAALPQILVADFDDPATSFGVVEGHRYWRVSSHQIKAAAIIEGAGWGSVPLALVEAELREGKLSSISYRGQGPSSRRPVFLYQKSEKAQGPVATFIWEACADAARLTTET